MKNHVFLILLLMLGTVKGISQSSIVAEINLVQQTFEVTNTSETLQISPLQYPERVKNLNAELVNNEIVLTYQLDRTGKEQFYRIGLQASINGNPLPIQPEQVTDTYGPNVIVKNSSDVYQTTWGNLIESYLNLEGQLVIDLEVSLERNYTCPDERPTFLTWKKQRLNIVTGTLGLGSIFAGQIYGRLRDDNLAEYRRLNDEFYTLPPEALSEAQKEADTLFETINDQDDRCNLLTTIGFGILIGDLVWEYVQLSRFFER